MHRLDTFGIRLAAIQTMTGLHELAFGMLSTASKSRRGEGMLRLMVNGSSAFDR
jgi:hypothetical protein